MTKLIVALDEPTFERALDVLHKTGPAVAWYKVGYEAYYGYGDRIMGALRGAGKSIFLDLKLHDIPNTVAAGVRAAAKAGARLLTVHAAGGAAMMRAAASARDEMDTDMRVVAVTVLTSMSDAELHETGIEGSASHTVLQRARLASGSGLDGVVCAVGEAAGIRHATDARFAIVCPGIRAAGSASDDQRRVATAADAVRAGADFIVVGRPITQANDPASAAERIVEEMKTAR